MNIAETRKLFPITSKYVYLNNAAESPLNVKVHQKLDEFLWLETHEPHNKPPVRSIVRQKLSEIFGGVPRDYALVTSTGVGIGIAASGYPWRRGDNVVVPVDEHWNNTFPWLTLRERGVDVRLVPLDQNERVDPDTISAMVDNNTRILATTAVRFNTGFRADLKLLSKIAHEKGALLVVDGIQGAGVFPIKVEEDGIDVLACGGFKWLLGMAGTGFLYLNQNAREKIRAVLPGMFAAGRDTREIHYLNDSRQYETGSIAYALFHSWTSGLEILQNFGINNIHDRVLLLTDRIISGLKSKPGIRIISPIEKIQERSAIISFTLGSENGNKICHQLLMNNNILVALRGEQIRVSPNFYNTEDEIDHFLEMVT